MHRREYLFRQFLKKIMLKNRRYLSQQLHIHVITLKNIIHIGTLTRYLLSKPFCCPFLCKKHLFNAFTDFHRLYIFFAKIQIILQT